MYVGGWGRSYECSGGKNMSAVNSRSKIIGVNYTLVPLSLHSTCLSHKFSVSPTIDENRKEETRTTMVPRRDHTFDPNFLNTQTQLF